jgi:heme/copper-type cytochrome/quinol oxidase subunit 4
VTDPGFTNYVPRRTLVVWVVLVVLTCATWVIGSHRVFTPTAVTAAVLSLALIKVRLIGSNFMELSTAPRALALSLDVYLVSVYVGLMGMYVIL